MKITRLFCETDEPGPWLSMPELSEVLANPERIPDHLLRPLLRVEGEEISPRLAGIPLVIVAHEVGIDELEWRVDDAGRYVLERYSDVFIEDPARTRERLEAYIEDEHDGPEGLEDENAELFEVEGERSWLRDDKDAGEVEVHIGEASWLQHRGGGTPSDDGDFAFALVQHPNSFGAYYLFVDVDERRVYQVFQCT